MGTIASQITSLTIVYSIVYSDADHRKHQSSASLAFVRWIHRGPVNSPHKWPVTRNMFPFDDVIMSLGNCKRQYSTLSHQIDYTCVKTYKQHIVMLWWPKTALCDKTPWCWRKSPLHLSESWKTSIRILNIHYTDVIMTTMASQITSLTVVYSIVYSGVDQRKHQSSASLAFVPFDDVIMICPNPHMLCP